MLTGVLLSFVWPVRYTAVTKLMPPQQTPSTASLMMNQLTEQRQQARWRRWPAAAWA